MFDLTSRPPRGLMLASGSRFRKEMLERAGVPFSAQAALVDETELRRRLSREQPELSPQQVALALAEAKARNVAQLHPGKRVLGSDQILALPDRAAQTDHAHEPTLSASEILTKPGDLIGAAAQIRRLSGRTHELHTAAVLMVDDVVEWQTVKTATLSMRQLSEREIERYVARAGPALCETVGAYMVEGLGAQLFDRIDGDYFTIIGLPLLDVLAALRATGEVTL